jgi:hypothetical protein
MVSIDDDFKTHRLRGKNDMLIKIINLFYDEKKILN